MGPNAPLVGALIFACSLSAVTIWFAYGAIGPVICLLGLALALAIVGLGTSNIRELMLPLLLALSGLGLALFSGGLNGPAASAILWPVLGMAALGALPRKYTTNPVSPTIGNGIVASFGVLIGLALLGNLISVPVYGAITAQSGILALGVGAALAIAAIVRANKASQTPSPESQSKVLEANQTRDVALIEAQTARNQTRERAQFMAEMSHEIRTPLNAILGFADTMRAQVFGPLPAAYGDYPDLIHTSGTHLLDVVSDLLDLSKIEAGRYETSLRPIILDDVASEGVALSGGTARSTGVQIRHEVSDPIEVIGDRRALRQIAFNLISNAIKFTPAGGKVIVRVTKDAANGTASLEVDDTGVGMTAADLARIGQPWNQVNEETAMGNKRARGSGLGLALVKRLAELQGGRLDLSSTLGVGTKAAVVLPLAATAQSDTATRLPT
jgi:signal transduction histidine kinase